MIGQLENNSLSEDFFPLCLGEAGTMYTSRSRKRKHLLCHFFLSISLYVFICLPHSLFFLSLFMDHSSFTYSSTKYLLRTILWGNSDGLGRKSLQSCGKPLEPSCRSMLADSMNFRVRFPEFYSHL